ncbi:hypothetical protein DAMA08_052130 [Martiniozyma asiatica (nom. inval.)]|nr:hypothetical protein DAMA08_052130 [Martiniozyma asiatica]
MSIPFKVTVIGAAGGIGQPLSLLLKLNSNITHLSLYDVVNIPGVAADLNHIDTDVKISYHMKKKEESGNSNSALLEALENSDCVIIPAGVPRKPGMTRDDLFKINASICAEIAQGICIASPNAITMVISNPVNSTTAIFKEIFIKNNCFNAKKLFGITALDHVRSNTFLSELVDGKSPQHYNVQVVGGHSGHSIVPLFSQVDDLDALNCLNDEKITEALIHRVQYGGDEVVEAKQGTGSSTLSMAYAASKFFNIVLNGVLNKSKTVISAYVSLDKESDSIPGCLKFKSELGKLLGDEIALPKFFAVPMSYSNEGVECIDWEWIKKINSLEKEMIKEASEFINQGVEKGTAFVVG